MTHPLASPSGHIWYWASHCNVCGSNYHQPEYHDDDDEVASEVDR